MLTVHSAPRASAVKQPSNIMVLLENQLVDSALHHVMTCFANLKMGFRANNIGSCSLTANALGVLRSYYAINVRDPCHIFSIILAELKIVDFVHAPSMVNSSWHP